MDPAGIGRTCRADEKDRLAWRDGSPLDAQNPARAREGPRDDASRKAACSEGNPPSNCHRRKVSSRDPSWVPSWKVSEGRSSRSNDPRDRGSGALHISEPALTSRARTGCAEESLRCRGAGGRYRRLGNQRLEVGHLWTSPGQDPRPCVRRWPQRSLPRLTCPASKGAACVSTKRIRDQSQWGHALCSGRHELSTRPREDARRLWIRRRLPESEGGEPAANRSACSSPDSTNRSSASVDGGQARPERHGTPLPLCAPPRAQRRDRRNLRAPAFRRPGLHTMQFRL